MISLGKKDWEASCSYLMPRLFHTAPISYWARTGKPGDFELAKRAGALSKCALKQIIPLYLVLTYA